MLVEEQAAEHRARKAAFAGEAGVVVREVEGHELDALAQGRRQLVEAGGNVVRPQIRKMSRSTSGSASIRDAIARTAGAKNARSGVKQVAVRMAPVPAPAALGAVSSHAQNCLILISFGLGAIIAGVKGGRDLFRVDEADVGRRIGGDPKHFRTRRFDLFDVVRDGMGNAGEERRRQSIGDRDDESALRTCDHIHMSGVRTDAPIHGVALADESGTNRSGQR